MRGRWCNGRLKGAVFCQLSPYGYLDAQQTMGVCPFHHYKLSIMAKRKVSRKKPKINAENAAQTKKFFTITGILVLVLLMIIFFFFSQS